MGRRAEKHPAKINKGSAGVTGSEVDFNRHEKDDALGRRQRSRAGEERALEEDSSLRPPCGHCHA